MVLILESIKMLVYFLCVTTIGELFFYYPKRNIRYRNIALLIWSFLTAIIISNSHIVVQVVIHIVSVLAVLELWFKKSLKNYLTLYIGSIAVLSMLAVLINITFNEIVRFIHFNGIKEVFELLTYVLIFIATRIVGKYYEKKYNRGLVNIGTKYWLFFIGILFFDAVIIKVMGSYILDNVKAERRYIIIFLFWCVVNGLLIQLVLLINTLVTRNTHRDNENLAKQFLESQNEHYQYLEKKEHETKKFRHDIKNHLMLLKDMIEAEQYKEADAYLDTINEKVSSFSNKISVNNDIADAILNRFFVVAQDSGIELKVNGHFPMRCYIAAYDICTVLSNLLSNAIRAELEAEGKEILVDIKYTDNKLLFILENDYSHDLIEEDGVFQTTKDEPYLHGLGLNNVKECVEKNGGYLSLTARNHRFKARVMMLNEKEE